MPFFVQCPGCGKKLRARAELAGKQAKCPACGGVVAIPAPAAASSAGSAEAPVAAQVTTPAPAPAPGPAAGGNALPPGFNVWYATHERAESTSKVLVFDDRGTLQPTVAGFYFAGRKGAWNLNSIQKISLVCQRIPWKTLLVLNAVAVPVVILGVIVEAAKEGAMDGARIAAGIAGVVMFLLIMNGFSLLMSRQVKWIQVDHHDEAGTLQHSYFADSSGMGWGGILGGTSRLYAALAFGDPTHASAAPATAVPLPAATRPPPGAPATLRVGQPRVVSPQTIPGTSGWAVASLICGILAVLTFCVLFPSVLFAPAAVITGHLARRAVRTSSGRKTGGGMAIAGLVMGYFILVMLAMLLVLLMVGKFQVTFPAPD